MPYQVRRIGFGLGLAEATAKQLERVPRRPATGCSSSSDASQVEINPLVVTKAGDLVALDAKLNFDDNALYRHPDVAKLRDPDEEDPREREAKEIDLAYVGLDGNIGCMVNGAGLAMATLDMIQVCGGKPANFLDAGGGADKEKVKEAFKLILRDANVKAILVNIFGGIVRCDLIAEGVVAAAQELGVQVPLVVRLQGTNAAEGRAILAASGLDITPAETLREAGEKAVGRGARASEALSDGDPLRQAYEAARAGPRDAWASSTRSSRASTARRWWAASRRARAAQTIDGIPGVRHGARRGEARPARTPR